MIKTTLVKNNVKINIFQTSNINDIGKIINKIKKDEVKEKLEINSHSKFVNNIMDKLIQNMGVDCVLKKAETLEKLCLYPKKKIPYSLTDEELKGLNVMQDLVYMVSGMVLLTKEWVKKLSRYINHKRCLEICAGTGYLSKALKDCGTDIITTDLLIPGNYSNEVQNPDTHWTHVEKMEALKAIELYGSYVDFLIGSWIEKDRNKTLNFDYECFKAFKKKNPNGKMICIGAFANTFSIDLLAGSTIVDSDVFNDINKCLPSFDNNYKNSLFIIE